MKILTWMSLTLLVSCRHELKEVVAEYISSKHLTLSDCGTVKATQCGTWTPSEADRAAMTCLTDAFAACTPSRASFTRPTVEGDPIVSDLLITGTPGACAVIQFYDTRADAFGPRTITRSRCTQLIALEQCGGLPLADQCTTEETY